MIFSFPFPLSWSEFGELSSFFSYPSWVAWPVHILHSAHFLPNYPPGQIQDFSLSVPAFDAIILQYCCPLESVWIAICWRKRDFTHHQSIALLTIALRQPDCITADDSLPYSAGTDYECFQVWAVTCPVQPFHFWIDLETWRGDFPTYTNSIFSQNCPRSNELRFHSTILR